MHTIRRTTLSTVCALLLFTASACAQVSQPITIHVDATDAPRNLLHAQLRIPARPGKVTLLYPKWIPGEHGPTGPITDLVDLKMTAAGQTVTWQRDPENLYAFHLEVPAGAEAIDVALDFLLSSGSGDFSSSVSATPRLVDLNWNQVLLYPQGAKSSELTYSASLRLPKGWKFGTALPLDKESSEGLQFKPVSLETLVDSPLIASVNFRTVDLSPGANPPHWLHIVADNSESLEIKPEDIAYFSRLVREIDALFGAKHYHEYHFLLTLSDHVGHFGLEHHQSSDDRVQEQFLIDDEARRVAAGLLPHEMVHSWNGKYRRPADIATPDFQQPMKTDLLWVYEGLTTYLGDVLTTRSGLCSKEDFLQGLALDAARLDRQPGRQWRSLADTAVAAQLLYRSPRAGNAARRGTDFYPEGELIWLDADVLIRQQTQGAKSLDDFCKKFFGGQDSEPKVIPYTFDDLIAALNEIAPYDWRQFFQARVYSVNPHAPLGGIESGGWRLVYTDARPDLLKAIENQNDYTDAGFSLGFSLGNKEGFISDVVPGSSADRAGLIANMKLIAVNGRKWTPDILRSGIKATKTEVAPIELLIEHQDTFKTYKLDYRDGEQYPALERDSAKPDLLSQILRPLIK